MAIRITVIGAGPGGYVAAVRAARLGAEVTVIERDNVGGTCLNRGCIPSKVMITTAELLEKLQRAGEFGIDLDGAVRPDLQRLMARKEKVVQDQSKGILNLLEHHRVRYLRGSGRVTGPGLAAVQLADGQELEVPWDRLILAPGTRPLQLPAFPFDGRQILSSDHALNLQEVPRAIMILGGGVIGCEFACLLSALGAQVTVVEALDRLLPLPTVDEDCSKIIHREMKKRKIKFILNRTAEAVEKTADGLLVTLGPSLVAADDRATDQRRQQLAVDRVLVCIGRSPNTAGLGLEALGVAVDERGWLPADAKLQTNVPGVYAIGDVLGPSRIMLAHVASAEGLVAAENALGGNRTMAYDAVPGAIFTLPEVASVGLTEARARAAGRAVRADRVLFRTVGKAQVLGEIAGEAKIVSEVSGGRILGVHLVGPHATDLIAEATLALRLGATVQQLADTIHAHPTLSEIMLEASWKALDQPLHG